MTTLTTSYYLSYGSNLNIEQMKQRCPTARKVGSSVIKGYRLALRSDLQGPSYFTIIQDLTSQVPVGIWEIGIEDEVALDDYEAYPSLYRKEYFTVDFAGQQITALIYIMNSADYHLPTADYITTCRIGFRDFGFNERLIDQAIAEITDLHNQKSHK